MCRGFGVQIGTGTQGSDKKENQAIGGYCRGKDLEECRKMFGEGLARVCSSCPD